ncbi:hypothetical protein EST38_g11932 [Candolleomyces aberdarensis]|uniref:Uncharacterized protein n=1 Tax=Candolleomyces aberdarensis TaxID=2316362 RepID=A0A4Q2D3P0_9AGAR|nr:hypothetical protein EST38_g11932 [Candolleomyces aberdarensis]
MSDAFNSPLTSLAASPTSLPVDITNLHNAYLNPGENIGDNAPPVHPEFPIEVDDITGDRQRHQVFTGNVTPEVCIFVSTLISFHDDRPAGRDEHDCENTGHTSPTPIPAEHALNAETSNRASGLAQNIVENPGENIRTPTRAHSIPLMPPTWQIVNASATNSSNASDSAATISQNVSKTPKFRSLSEQDKPGSKVATPEVSEAGIALKDEDFDLGSDRQPSSAANVEFQESSLKDEDFDLGLDSRPSLAASAELESLKDEDFDLGSSPQASSRASG